MRWDALPSDIMVVFAGGASREQAGYLGGLIERARIAGTADRIRVTGYLPENELEQYLAATDLAVCPFAEASASGSLSTWISVQSSVLASDLPLIAEYNSIEPGAIDTFYPYTASALADAICRLLSRGSGTEQPVGRLRQKLSISRTLASHVRVYKQLVHSAGSRR